MQISVQAARAISEVLYRTSEGGGFFDADKGEVDALANMLGLTLKPVEVL